MWDTSQREPTIIKSMRKLITNVQKMRERAGDVVALSRAASEAQYEGDTLNYEHFCMKRGVPITWVTRIWQFIK